MEYIMNFMERKKWNANRRWQNEKINKEIKKTTKSKMYLLKIIAIPFRSIFRSKRQTIYTNTHLNIVTHNGYNFHFFFRQFFSSSSVRL